MVGNGYKYDVAFSFLAQDEQLATELNDLLQERVKTFLYSERQREIAGTDGEKAFSSVFGEEARLVVVLYREGWGQTPWTRIEETAIRGRAYDHSYDFVIFVPLDSRPTVPQWLPRTQLWVGLDRWGVSGAASVIESRVSQLGGETHEETVTDRAARLSRRAEFEKERRAFLGLERGVQAADGEFARFLSELGAQIEEINKSITSFSLSLNKECRKAEIIGVEPSLMIEWKRKYANSLDGAELVASLWRSHTPFSGGPYLEKPDKIGQMMFVFDYLPSKEVCWKSLDAGHLQHASEGLAAFLLKKLMDKVDERLSRH